MTIFSENQDSEEKRNGYICKSVASPKTNNGKIHHNSKFELRKRDAKLQRKIQNGLKTFANLIYQLHHCENSQKKFQKQLVESSYNPISSR